MKALLALLIAALAGCASAPPMPPVAGLLHDDAFAPASVPIDPAAALALNGAMRNYVSALVGSPSRRADKRRQLVDALVRGELKLEYDSARTRTAAEAFEARSGNCLALVMMTAALAKELGLIVHYQSVIGEPTWDRSGDLHISIGHVNLSLDERRDSVSSYLINAGPMVIDFLPPRDARLLPTRRIDERTVIAMYLNNRAVESLALGLVDNAYWWAREAMRLDPELMAAYLTLGVVYRTRHLPDAAEQVLQRVLEREPENLLALSNRTLALRDLGRTAEADALAQRLAALDPNPPFSHFNAGMAAYRAGRFDEARRLFAKEVARAPHHHEFEFWLGLAHLAEGNAAQAQVHLTRAMEASTTRRDHDLYAAKLDRLKALRAQ